VLVEGDDAREPVTDTVKALLDGHIALSRRLAERGSFPAIDVLRSLSRCMPAVTGAGHLRDAVAVRGALATLEHAEDLFAIGAYRPGGDNRLDAAVAARESIDALVFSGDREADAADTLLQLRTIAQRLALVE
jgi:flagellum-specific ATP synthase